LRTSLLLTLAATLAFAACSGGGGGSSTTPPVTSGGGTTQQQSSTTQSEDAIDATNSVGTPVKSFTNFDSSITAQSTQSRTAQSIPLGTCNNGVEFFAPDKNNDPNSTERQFFYDSACTELARDTVRIYTINGTSETVNRTESLYAINNATAIAVRADAVSFQNGTFGTYGYPVAADGFAESATGTLNISGSRTSASDDELVLSPSSNNVSTFCSDSAGYNATGIQSLGETFGWQGAVLSGGTRTINADGSVTWQATHAGSTSKGAIGSLSILAGTPNTTCPISTPQFTLSGGTTTGTYSIPVTATYKSGVLESLTVTNATLANGDTLNVTTNSNVSPTSNTFITGSLANSGTQIATFAVDAFGDGTLTVTKSGAQYVITDWHVVK